MMYYIKELGSILMLMVTLINLNSFKFKIRELILMFFTIEVVGIIALGISEYALIIPMIVIPAILIYKNSKNIVRSVSTPVIAIIILVLSDSVSSNVIASISVINIELLKNDLIVYWLAYMIDLILIFFITKLFGIFINRKLKLSNLELKGRFGLLIVISLVLTLIIFYTNIIFESNNGSGNQIIKINGILFFSYFILLMIIMHILITSMSKEMDLKNKQIQFENLQEYTDNLEKLYTDMRIFRHDYINILSSMIGYIQNRDIDGLERHFHEKIFPLSKGMESNNYKIGLLKNIKIPEIKGIVSSKLIRAQELGVDVYIDIVQPIEKINMDILDFSRVVGILIDNAIEAAEKCDKPSIKVAFIDKDNTMFFVIINSINEEIPINKIFLKDFSTKGENRGLGLYNLKEITNKYRNVAIDTSIENSEFKQLIRIASK